MPQTVQLIDGALGAAAGPAGGFRWTPSVVSASQSEEEGVAALGAVHRIIFIVEVQDIFLRFEAELLIEQHGGITGRHVQRHVFAHTGLKQTHSSPSPSSNIKYTFLPVPRHFYPKETTAL